MGTLDQLINLGRELINRGQVRSSLVSRRVRQAGAMSGMGHKLTSAEQLRASLSEPVAAVS